jgi:hypothetical protein
MESSRDRRRLVLGVHRMRRCGLEGNKSIDRLWSW